MKHTVLQECAFVNIVFSFSRYKELLGGKAQLEEREKEMKMEREAMEAEAQKKLETERELERMKEDNER